MKLQIALGIAAAALTVAAASAQSTSRVVIRHGGSDVSIDANDDGYITRAEASSAFERIFADLDTNNDGKLDDADRPRFERHSEMSEHNVHVFSGGNGREVRIINGELDDETQARIEREIDEATSRADAAVERAERAAERADRMSERAEREAERAAERAERDAERAAERAEHEGRYVRRIRTDGGREIIIIRSDDGEGGSWTNLEGAPPVPPVPGVPPTPAVAPVPPVPPVPPMPFMMLIANSEEADRNGDGALSREEFVAQHLRFFDASDANGDGRVRYDPPRPPEPPVAPTPPEPPRRR